MVSPERLGHRITGIEIDSKNSDTVQIFIDVSVDTFIRWTLEYSVKGRSFTAYDGGGANLRYITGKMTDYLISRLSPEQKAYCLAASLGVVHGKPEPDKAPDF